MNNLSKINHDQKLYVLTCGDGYTTLGFDYAFKTASAVAIWAKVEAPKEEWKGTELGYADYLRCMEAGQQKYLKFHKQFDYELVPQLIGLEDKRVEVVDYNGEKRRFTVGKSCGWMPCHLEIKSRRSTGGPAVMGTPFQSIRVVK